MLLARICITKCIHYKKITIKNQHFITRTTIYRRSLLLTPSLNLKILKSNLGALHSIKKSEKENLIPGPKKKLQRFKKPLKK